MTETTAAVQRLVPEGKELTDLKIVELDYASKKCGADVVAVCASPDHPRKQMALACVALVWARRTNPSEVLETYTDMEVEQLYNLLGLLDRKKKTEETPAENPTASEPA